MVIVMVTVTRKYQVTIPKEVREALGIKAGDKVVFVKSKEGYIITTLDKLLDEFVEALKDIEEVSEAVRESFRRAIDENSS